jgi:hypothetical protein
MPIADIFFNYMMNHNMKLLQQQLTTIYENKFNTHSDVTAPYFLSWVDDVAILINAPNNTQLVQTIQQVTHTTHHHFAQQGLQLNFKKNKTECLVMFRGPNSRNLYRQHMIDNTAKLHITNTNPVIPLQLTYTYTYLGTLLDSNATYTGEIKSRIAQTQTEALKIIPPLNKQRHLPHNTKHTIVNTLLYTKLTYNSHTWWPLTNKNNITLENYHTNIQRRLNNQITNEKDNIHYTTHQALQSATIPNLNTQLSINRLRFFYRIINHAPEFLFDLLSLHHQLQPSKSYLTRITQDIQQLSIHNNQLQNIPMPEDIHIKPCWTDFTSKLNWKPLLTNIKHTATNHQNRQHTHTSNSNTHSKKC